MLVKLESVEDYREIKIECIFWGVLRNISLVSGSGHTEMNKTRHRGVFILGNGRDIHKHQKRSHRRSRLYASFKGHEWVCRQGYS